jgi:O-antigen/teichoic acid export membrane protein
LLTLASPAAYLIARVLLLDKWGAVQTGLMAAAFGFGVAVRTAMSQANALYLTPLANRATPRSDRAAAVSHYARTLTVLFLLGVLPIVLFPDLFLRLLYSRGFVSASTSVGTFMIAEGLLLMAGVYQSLLIGFDDVNGYTALSVIANMVTIAASIVLIPAFGIIGCAIAFVCGNGILLILTLLRLATFHALTSVIYETGIFWTGMLLLAILSWWVMDPSRSPLAFRLVAGLSGYVALIAMLPFAEIRSMLVMRMPRRARDKIVSTE